jgi:dolichol-phosphate mannosyltransferase
LTEISIIIPTYNEVKNIPILIALLREHLHGLCWQAIIVDDDSPDGTYQIAKEISEKDKRISCIRRVNERGLSSACIEGMTASKAKYLAVIDADLQHPVETLPKMLAVIKHMRADILVGTRYKDGQISSDWPFHRRIISKAATNLSKLILSKKIVTDPMSGYFLITKEFFEEVRPKLSGVGFKILFDILTMAPSSVKISEFPIKFGIREHGESKLNSLVAWQFLMYLAQRMTLGAIPISALSYFSVGLLGVLLHFMCFHLLFILLSIPFETSQFFSSTFAMLGNFLLNNALTFRPIVEVRQKLIGYFKYAIICCLGALLNTFIATECFKLSHQAYFSAGIGILVVALWNYFLSKKVVWRTRF